MPSISWSPSSALPGSLRRGPIRPPAFSDRAAGAEHQAWWDFWTEVEKTLDRAQGKAAPKEDARKKP
jgi:hypothetical protein